MNQVVNSCTLNSDHKNSEGIKGYRHRVVTTTKLIIYSVIQIDTYRGCNIWVRNIRNNVNNENHKGKWEWKTYDTCAMLIAPTVVTEEAIMLMETKKQVF